MGVDIKIYFLKEYNCELHFKPKTVIHVITIVCMESDKQTQIWRKFTPNLRLESYKISLMGKTLFCHQTGNSNLEWSVIMIVCVCTCCTCMLLCCSCRASCAYNEVKLSLSLAFSSHTVSNRCSRDCSCWVIRATWSNITHTLYSVLHRSTS